MSSRTMSSVDSTDVPFLTRTASESIVEPKTTNEPSQSFNIGRSMSDSYDSDNGRSFSEAVSK
jgi:hypothetical protein